MMSRFAILIRAVSGLIGNLGGGILRLAITALHSLVISRCPQAGLGGALQAPEGHHDAETQEGHDRRRDVDRWRVDWNKARVVDRRAMEPTERRRDAWCVAHRQMGEDGRV